MGIVVDERVKSFEPISDRGILLQLNAKIFNENFIQTFTSKCDNPDKEMELFYEQLLSAINSLINLTLPY